MTASPNTYIADRDSQPGGVGNQTQMLFNVDEATGAINITVMYSNGQINTLTINPSTVQAQTAPQQAATNLANAQAISTPAYEPADSTFIASSTRLWLDELNGYLMFKSLCSDGLTFLSGRVAMQDLVTANDSDYTFPLSVLGAVTS